MKKFNQNSRYDFSIIENWTHPNSKVLDLGCGDGALLNYLKEKKDIKGFGIEKNEKKWLLSLKNNIDVIQMDLESGLAAFETKSFDLVILSRTIQSIKNIEEIIHEMMRVGKEVVITFPNFGYWRIRASLMFIGKMPQTEALSYNWYDTPNIHFCTVKDFETLCEEKGIQILARQMVGNTQRRSLLASTWPNLFASTAIYHISR
jgi:methionine biosynthesis protein MetW